MAKMKPLAAYYLNRADRNVEVLQVGSTIFYIYNYEGIHYRLFDCLIELINFFQGIESKYLDFNEDDELDNYLENFA